QAEDGIRDFHVTGVQTCALPILYSLGTVIVFLSCLCGSEQGNQGGDFPKVFLSCLCGSEPNGGKGLGFALFLSCLCGSERATLQIGRASCREGGGGAVVGGASAE